MERNAATSEETRISQRGQDFSLKQGQAPSRNMAADRDSGNTGHSQRQEQSRPNAEQTQKYQDFRDESTPHVSEGQPGLSDTSSTSRYETTSGDIPGADHSHQARSDRGTVQSSGQEAQRTKQQSSARRITVENDTQNAAFKPEETGAYDAPPAPAKAPYSAENQGKQPQNATDGTPKAPRAKERTGRLHFSDEETPQGSSGGKPRQHGTKYGQKFSADAAKHGKESAAPERSVAPETSAATGKLNFTADELPPDEKLSKLKGKAAKADLKLENARKRLPSKRKVKIDRVFDEEKGKAKHRLHFEKEALPPGAAKQSLPKKAGNAAAWAVANKAHQKISEMEKDNVGVEAAHKAERSAERLYHSRKSAVRSKRNRRYNKVAKLEKRAAKSNVKYTYRKALSENPQLRSNIISRFKQKQQIKRQYAKAAREAKRTKQAAKKAGDYTAKAAKAVTGFISRHPMLIVGAAVIFLLIIFISAAFTSCSSMGGGGFSSILLSSYTSEDADILAVENAYTQLESELQEQVDNIESDCPGYDEYRYSLAQIGHDPYALASYLTCIYYDYTPDEVEAELQAIFGRQYTLTITEEVEVRYRTETRTDSEGNSYTEEVAYNYYILNVTLTNSSLYSVAAANLDADQLELYSLYMETKGNKDYLFEGSAYIGGGDYADYDIPGEALSDERFAALIAEAEKYLGYPYVWGGSSPSTSFDCSGFVCYVLNQSGTASVGRTTANGLYNMCTIVSAGEAKPGDLIFFQGTYNTSGASHVGIYVGGGMMIHCGNPIQYTSINTNYWQSHFMAYGRIN